jgi:ABC-2 type transport system permease protein
VVQAVFRRNFISYFGAPTGYVFIAVFVILSAAMAFWRDVFFTNNLANLDALNRYFPYLLLFFVPAVAMSAWAEERKQGTDELLFTLPAKDVEVVLGKYLALLGIYGVALVFSLTHVVVLRFLGSPDVGVMLGTYLGYFLLGGALLAVAMAASLLTSSQTVAFILGALFCSVIVFLGDSGNIVGGRLQGWLEGLGIDAAFDDLAAGAVSLRSLLHFGAIAAVFLYLNLVLLKRRHVQGPEARLHSATRLTSLGVMGISLGILSSRGGCRVDLTQERLHTLSAPTLKVIEAIDPGRPVLVTAFVSPEVPEAFVETKETLLALLREYDARGGDRVQLRVVDTERYSKEAQEAEDQFGIRGENVRDNEDGEEDFEGIHLGLAFTCGAEQVVIPFVHRGLPLEYELTRSIGVVTGAKRRRVGVVTTDARVFGGLDFSSMSSQGEWQIITELKKQYDVVQVGLDSPITEKYDVILAAMPSSLGQAQMDVLLDYVKKGNPALIFDDPFMSTNPGLSASYPKRPPRPPMGGFMPPPPQNESKGDLARFMGELGVQFGSDTIVWDTYNPHPRFRTAPREILFVGPGSGNPRAVSAEDPITSGLQEFVVIFGGDVRPRPDSPLAFTPLLMSTRISGSVHVNQRFQNNPFTGGVMQQEVRYLPRGQELTLAARVKGSVPAAPAKDGKPAGAPSQINAIVVADMDCISDMFFQMRREAPELRFDNITFVLNAVDVLAGDESYVSLRKRRPKHRTLERFEAQTKGHDEKLLEESKAAEERAEKERQDAQARLDAKVKEVEARTDIDERRKEIELQTLRNVEQKKFDAATREIDARKKAAVERSRTTMKQGKASIKKFIRNLAVFLPPIPPVLIGIYVLLRRLAAQGRTA